MSKKSTSSRPSRKAPAKLPLTRHPRGYWCKKVKGKLHYFGKIAGDENGQAALALWLDQKDDPLAGRTPRVKGGDGLTLVDLTNRFLTSKQRQLTAGEIGKLTFLDYHRVCAMILAQFGQNRLVDDLASDDFESLKAVFVKGRGPVAWGNLIRRSRVMFKYGYDAGLIDKPVRYGPQFKTASKTVLRKDRNQAGPRMFEAKQIRQMIDTAGPQLRAMILLGINCGFGNSDCATLPLTAVDLQDGWITFPRPKTGIGRRCPLWPETVEAIKIAIAERQGPPDKYVFVCRETERQSRGNLISKATATLLKNLGIDKPGLNFYALRHCFLTIAEESHDFPAVRFIMGHNDPSMAGLYREHIGDERLQAVADHVRGWLFGSVAGDAHQDVDHAPADDERPALRVVG
jgi:integrase